MPPVRAEATLWSRSDSIEPLSEAPAYLREQLITYIGNKRSLLHTLESAIRRIRTRLGKDKLRTLDAFSGSGIVSRFLKQYSSLLISNDLETFARVIRHWDSFRQQASPLTWMVQISTNWCLNRLRDHKGHVRKHDERRQEIVGDGVTRTDVVGTLDAGRLRELLADEDEETQRIVVHLYFDDLTREETAKLVGISVPTLRKRHDAFLKRARRALGAAAVPAAALFLLFLSYGLVHG